METASRRLLCLSLLLAVFAACSSSDDNPAPGPGDASVEDASHLHDGGLGITCSGANPSFEQDVHPLINSCGAEGSCHGGIVAGTWPYNSLVNKTISRDTDGCDPSTILVTPRNLEKSYLLNKLTGIGMCSGVRMPKLGPPYFSPQQLQIIADWICQGAQEN